MGEATAATTDRGTRRRQRTRAALIDAARRLMATRGIDAVPVAELTEEADVAVGSFYNHFQSKEELLEAVIAETVEARGATIDRLTAGMSDPAHVLSTGARLTVRSLDRDPVWGWLMMRVLPFGGYLRASLGTRLLRDLQAGFRAGRFSASDEETALAAIGGAVLGVMHAKLLGGLPADADSALAEQLLRSLGLPEGEAAEIARRPVPEEPTGSEGDR